MDIIRIYRQEPGAVTSAGVVVKGCTSLEAVGGPKRYMRIWDGLDRIEWGWVVSSANVLIWGPPMLTRPCVQCGDREAAEGALCGDCIERNYER